MSAGKSQGGSGGMSRRRFLGESVRGLGLVALAGTGLGLAGRVAGSLPADCLRPPGARAEEDFLSACVRCGLCVRDCPYDTLRLAGPGNGPAAGSPYFVAREVPCEMCEDIPCVAACPTGALDKDLEDIDNAKMGVAVLVGHESCLNYLGLRCDVCYRVCPLLDEAITLEAQHNLRTEAHTSFIPVVHSDKCTGCGKCEGSCVLPESAIKVLPERLAKGRVGEHYRLGWEEKRKRGKSLVEGVIDLPDRGREGQPGMDAGSGKVLDLPKKKPDGGYKGFEP